MWWGFDGSGKHRLSAGSGTHAAKLSPDGSYYMDDYSNVSSPIRSVLYDNDGKQVSVYREANRKAIDEYDLRPVENVSMKAADGTLLYAHLIRPAGFQSGT